MTSGLLVASDDGSAVTTNEVTEPDSDSDQTVGGPTSRLKTAEVLYEFDEGRLRSLERGDYKEKARTWVILRSDEDKRREAKKR